MDSESDRVCFSSKWKSVRVNRMHLRVFQLEVVRFFDQRSEPSLLSAA
jgi:hypothetical protein